MLTTPVITVTTDIEGADAFKLVTLQTSKSPKNIRTNNTNEYAKPRFIITLTTFNEKLYKNYPD